MTILVGYPPNRQGKAMLGLAAVLAGHVQRRKPGGVHRGPRTMAAQGSSEKTPPTRATSTGVVESALAQARGKAAARCARGVQQRPGPLAPSGLLEAAEQHSGDPDRRGVLGGGDLGTSPAEQRRRPTAAQLSRFRSPWRPAAFGPGDVDKVVRLTVAYTGTGPERATGAGGSGNGAPARCLHSAGGLRRPGRATETAHFSSEAEGVLRSGRRTFRQPPERVLEEDPEPGRGGSRRRAQFVIGHGPRLGRSALEDVEWRDGDVLVIGSRATRVRSPGCCLGSRAAKIVRHSLVPVLTFPRHAAEVLSRDG